MKRFFSYLMVVLALAACTPKENPTSGGEVTESLSVSPASLSFSADGTQVEKVSVTASGKWTVTVSNSWIQPKVASGTGNTVLEVSAAYNASDKREGKMTIKLGSLAKEVAVSQEGATAASEVAVVPSPAAFDGNKRASTTYQLLIYTFADSNNDGIGDFKGIQNHLDYLDALGVTALWLSPAHPTTSYHAYNVDDYNALNPLYGTEADFKNLIDAAHAKGIKIYMDYVLNHSGKNNEWFKTAVSSASNDYSSYYVLSQNPTSDVAAGKVDNYGGAKDPGMGTWHAITGGAGYTGRLHFKVDMNAKTVTVTKTSEAAQAPNTASPSMWLWYGNINSHVGMYTTGSNVYEITLDFDSDWGFLVCSSTNWGSGTKYGSSSTTAVQFGTPYPLYNNSNNDAVKNLIFGGYSTNYFASFDASMPDLNYGPYTSCENSAAFKATVASAKKWVEMGVDGFRLDAVIWVYQDQVTANQRFLDQWYQAVNKAYKDAGHSDNIFMVGEAWKDHAVEKLYYKGLTSTFEFAYGGMLSECLNNGNGSSYASKVIGYLSDHAAQRSDAITSLFLTNHDQDRWAEWVGKDATKQKQAAAMLLTSGGKPFIYMGEELGYYGTKSSGDEGVRQPMAWDRSLSDLCRYGLDDAGKSDAKMNKTLVSASNSVKAQEEDANSLLNVYKAWSRLRNTYPALATGTMSAHSTLTSSNTGAQSIAAWYMTSGTEKMLVIHNLGGTDKSVTISDDLTHPVALLGTASVTGKSLKLGAHSSVVFQLQ